MKHPAIILVIAIIWLNLTGCEKEVKPEVQDSLFFEVVFKENKPFSVIAAVQNLPSAVANLTKGFMVKEPAKLPSLPGYSFGGWYKEPDCKNLFLFALDSIVGNTNLFAKWTLQQPFVVNANSKRYLILSTSDVYDGSMQAGKEKPNGYKIVNETFGSFEGKSTAIGVAPMFRIFERSLDVFKATLGRHLQLSQQYNVPIFICLSSCITMGNRPDLWNWFDISQSSFNSVNTTNVEWTGWNDDKALRNSWVYWGGFTQMTPFPNRESLTFKNELKRYFTELGGIVKRWYDNLPVDKKWLFVGFRSTDEMWYPPLEVRETASQAIKDQYTYTGQTIVIPYGYAAVKTAGLASSGTLKLVHLNEVCRRHGEYTSKILFDLGFPREKIYCSSAGPTLGESRACINAYSCPSWSFYNADAKNPLNLPEAINSIQYSDAPQWAIAEWGLGYTNETPASLKGYLENCFAIPGNRFTRLTGEFFNPPTQLMDPKLIETLKLIIKE